MLITVGYLNLIGLLSVSDIMNAGDNLNSMWKRRAYNLLYRNELRLEP